jgi:transcriptional regulator with XRE-family HTH domain
MNIGKTIKRLRKHRGLTQKELSKLAGLKQSYLSQIETGRRLCSMSALNAIAEGLGTQPPFLIFYGIDENDVPKEKLNTFRVLHPHLTRIVEDILFKDEKI